MWAKLDDLDREQFDLEIRAAACADAEAGRARTWAELASEVLHGEVPEVDPELAEILGKYRRLGRDANGATLYTERVALLADAGVREIGEREAWHDLFDAMDDELAKVRREELDELKNRDT